MESAFLQPAEGERITAGGDLGVVLLVDVDDMGIAEVRSEPGGVAPPAHLHRRHAECLYVLEGELTIRLEGRELQAHPGTWVFVPQDVVHTFLVTGDTRSHFLDFHVPSCEFGAFVRGLHSAQSEEELRVVRTTFDQQPSPEYGGADPGLALLRRAGGADGETITDRPGRRVTLLVDADELAITESVYAPGEQGPAPHVHHHHADAFLVVEGEIMLTFRNGSLRAPAGTFVFVSPDVVHFFGNETTRDARFFNLHAPSRGFGDYLRGRNPDFDQHDPPADGGAEPTSVIVTRLSG